MKLVPIRAVVGAIAALSMFGFVERAAASSSPAATPAPTLAPAPQLAQPIDFSADIAAAKALQHKGRSRDAIAMLAADLQRDPGNRDVTVALAQTYSYAGDQGHAIALLDDLLKTSPDDADARVYLAQAYSFNRDYAAAEAQYHTVLTAAPDDEDAQVGLAQTYTFEGRFAEAKTLFQQVLAHDPNNSDARVGLAGAESFAGDYRRAASDYKAVLSSQPDNTDALVGLATVDYWLGDLAEAVTLDSRALGDDPGDSDARDLKHQLAIKTSPQIVSSATGTRSTDGVTNDYLVQERYYANPTTSIGLMQELYAISDLGVFVQAHRVGVVATYQGANDFGADLRVDESKFNGVPSVTDDVITFTKSSNGMTYGIGQSEGGVDGSVLANGGQIVPGGRSPLVRISTLFGDVGYTRRASNVNVTAQDAWYNDGNRFYETTVDASHIFAIGSSFTIAPDIGVRSAGFSNTYNDPALAATPGYYNFVSQRDVTLSTTAAKQFTEQFSAGLLATLGERRTTVLVYPYRQAPYQASPGTLPFQSFEPYLDFEGDRFSVTAAYYDYHFTGIAPVLPYTANTLDVNVSIRLP